MLPEAAIGIGLLVAYEKSKLPPPFHWSASHWDYFKKSCSKAAINLGIAVGWVGHESSGSIPNPSSCNELGLFQIMGAHPAGNCGDAISYAESEAGILGIPEADFPTVDTDFATSVYWGLRLARHYAGEVDKLGVQYSDAITDLYWPAVKLFHTLPGVASGSIPAALKAGVSQDWASFRVWAVNNGWGKYAKWFGHVDEVVQIGMAY